MTVVAPDGRLLALLTADLPGVELTAPRAPMTPQDWSMFAPQVHAHRQNARLLQLAAEDRWPLTDAQRDQLAGVARDVAASCLELDRELVRTVRRLRGFDVRVLKGAAYAHVVHPNPLLRSYVDVDLLLPSHEFERARELIVAMGTRRAYAEPRPGFDRRFGKGGTFVNPRGYAIDLHRTLTTGVFGLALDEEDLFTDGTSFTIGGEPLAALSVENMFLHACLTVGLEDGIRLDHLRDLAELAHLTSGSLDRIVERAHRWRIEVVVARAVTRVVQDLHLDPAHPWHLWAAAYRSSRRDRRWLAPYVGTTASYAGQTLVALEAIPGFRPRVSYTWAMVAPAAGSGRADLGQRVRTIRRSLRAWRPGTTAR